MTFARPIVILGAGGHARVLVATLRLVGATIRGVTSPVEPATAPGAPWLGDDDVLGPMSDTVFLVNGLGSVGDVSARRAIFEIMLARRFDFASVMHKTAIVADGVELGEGAQVMAGAIIQPGTRLGRNVLINTGAIVDHDCRIGANSHVAPGCRLSGGVILDDDVHLGVGATVIQGRKIGRGAIVGAGAVVIDDVAAGAVVAGVPARNLRPKE